MQARELSPIPLGRALLRLKYKPEAIPASFFWKNYLTKGYIIK